jgi:CheY-like chemotaxis protein
MKAESHPFDLLLMDLQMPEMNGLDATLQIRAREKEQGLARVPIVALTARAREEDRQRCFQVEMDGYLTKPLYMQTFTDLCTALLGSNS